MIKPANTAITIRVTLSRSIREKRKKLLLKLKKLKPQGKQKKAEILAAKSSKFKNRAKRSAEIDKGEQEYAKGLSTGKALALSLLAGDRVKGYAQYRAMSGQSGKNMTGGKVTSAALGTYMGSAGSRQRKAAYIRQDEGKKGLGQKVYKFNTKIQNKASDVIDRTAQANGGFPDREKQRKKRG